jgi:hypothetical protein
MKKGAYWKVPKPDRKAVLRKAIEVHQQNRELFRQYRF